MDALCFPEPNRIERIDAPEPSSPGPGEALVRTHWAGICGSDISGYLGRHPFFSYPRIPGHELGVEVLEVGRGVENVRPGDRCAVEPYLNNPTSHASRRGLSNCCQEVAVLGIHIDGGFCERFTVRADKLHPSSELSYEQLALVETLAIGRHACSRAAPAAGDRVLVIGAGPIGCSAIEFFRLEQSRITVLDLNDDRLANVQRLYNVEHAAKPDGEDDLREALLDKTDGEMYSYVVDATGSAASMGKAPRFARHGGTVVFIGNTTQPLTFDPTDLQKPELTIKMSRNALPEDFHFILRAIEEGRIDTQPWITHRSNLEEVADAFESYTRPETGVMKAMIRMP